MNGPHEVKHVLPPEKDAGDTVDRAEFDAFKKGYAQVSEEKDHQRGESLKDKLHWLTHVLIVVMAALLFFGIVTWAWHVLAPASWHWLDVSQWDRLKEAMSSALVAIVVSEYSKKFLGKLL